MVKVEFKYIAYAITALAAVGGGYYFWRRKKVNEYLAAKAADKTLP